MHLLKNSEKWGIQALCITAQARNSTGVQQQASEDVTVVTPTAACSYVQKQRSMAHVSTWMSLKEYVEREKLGTGDPHSQCRGLPRLLGPWASGQELGGM